MAFERRHSKINVLASPVGILENGQFEIFDWRFERLGSFGTTQMDGHATGWNRLRIEADWIQSSSCMTPPMHN